MSLLRVEANTDHFGLCFFAGLPIFFRYPQIFFFFFSRRALVSAMYLLVVLSSLWVRVVLISLSAASLLFSVLPSGCPLLSLILIFRNRRT